ncbi:MAG: 4-alpha-glucanotransferase [Defluviitaleaceae bacterium]|nr:4-alpha-glucanotransferase [Defluviitaleaceae bacterium]
MFNKRASGVLAHPTSFPGPYGMGDLGAGAYEFVDWLAEAGQTLWQILPLGPTGFGDSPYQSFSSFAGNPLLISPGELVKAGWLAISEVERVPLFDARNVDYGPVIEYKMGLFRKAYARFAKTASASFAAFCKDNAVWLDDFALYTAIKAQLIEARREEFKSPELAAYAIKMKQYLDDDQVNDYYYGAAWSSWPQALAQRAPDALKKAAEELADEIAFVKFLQYEFFRQWGALKAYANGKDIQIIGDIPIFVALDSADVWAQPELYCLDGDWPTAVAGCPPDYFAETGQLWGNPLYAWEAHAKEDYAWWTRRVQAVLAMVDVVRIDHFRGFEAYWTVPATEKTAINGKWTKGPGIALFDALKKNLGKLPIIAEDLGLITEEVDQLRLAAELPGMRVLQFGFDHASKSNYLPHHFEDSRTVVYSGTHDNDTTRGWYQTSATDKERDYLRRYLNVSGDDVAWDLIRLAYASNAVFAIVPIQDVLDYGTSARMNCPGEATGWWGFRFVDGTLTGEHAKRLAYLTELFHRGAWALDPEEQVKPVIEVVGG